MTYDHERALKVTGGLEPYLELEGTELSEAGSLVVHLLGYPDYISDELWESLMREAENLLKTFEEDFEIVEEEYTTTHKVKDLREKI